MRTIFAKLRAALRHFNWRSMRDHYRTAMQDISYSQFWGEPLPQFPRIEALRNVLSYRLGAAWCEIAGHDYHVEDFVNATYKEWPDDGLDHPSVIEDIDGGGVSWCCNRCGIGGYSYF